MESQNICLQLLCVYVAVSSWVSLCVSCHFPSLWFSSLAGSLAGNMSGFSASVARTFFFSLNLPEWDTLTWRPLLTVVLSTILSSRASSWELWTVSSVWAAAPVDAPVPCWPVAVLETTSAGISYRTLGWDFFLLRKVSFHQTEDDSAIMDQSWGGLRTEEREKRKKKSSNWNWVEIYECLLISTVCLLLCICVYLYGHILTLLI